MTLTLLYSNVITDKKTGKPVSVEVLNGFICFNTHGQKQLKGREGKGKKERNDENAEGDV